MTVYQKKGIEEMSSKRIPTMEESERAMSDYMKYTEEMAVIKKTARRLGCYVFYPQYHQKSGDKNTVLLYTDEDEKYNEKIDKDEFASNDQYKKYFWSFENSDINGMFSYDWCNFGSLDLRGQGWEKKLEKAIEDAYNAKMSNSHAR